MNVETEDQWVWGQTQETDITPSWIGGDGVFTEGVDTANNPLLRRVPVDASNPYASSFATVGVMLSAAARRGIAPPVLHVESDYIVMEKLPSTWRSAKLDELRDPYLLWAVLEQHRKVHDIPLEALPSVEKRELIDSIYRMREKCVSLNGSVPCDVDRLLSEIEPFLGKVDSFHESAVPCHGDGAASNVLIDTDVTPGNVSPPLLTGWTVSGIMDPLEEAGSILAEIGPFCGVPERLISGLGLSVEALPVAQTFAILDDLYWSLIGLWRSATAEDTSVDYAKYGLWRLIKARNQLCLPFGPAAWLARL